jgi:hypothetical protein
MNTWIFKDGATKVECTSFPYAFRAMWNRIKKNTEGGKRNPVEMMKSMSILSPIKDAYGQPKTYSYTEAKRMAESQGLLNAEGQINSREFKKS